VKTRESDVIFETNITSLEFLYRGKVRDIYKIDDDRLLVVQTDRLSAFDVVLPNPIRLFEDIWRVQDGENIKIQGKYAAYRYLRT